MSEALVLLLLFFLMIGMPLTVAMFPMTGWTMVALSGLASLVYWWPWVGVTVSSIIFVWRSWMSMPSTNEVWSADKMQPRSRLLVILGGDHTTEMLYDLSAVEDWREKFDAAYIIADSDNKSLAPANAFENDIHGRDAKVITIPGPSESSSSSMMTTVRATLSALRAVLVLWPDAIVCNGADLCVPVVIAAYIPRILWWKRIAILHSESFACVDDFSHSGGILFQLADVFTVQWDAFYQNCSMRAQYGHLLHGGRCRDGEKLDALPLEAQEGDGTAIVTVGPTAFDELIRAIDNQAFIGALKALGIQRLKVQKGNGSYEPTELIGDTIREAGIESEVLTHSPSLSEELRSASLIISHAGAGTVLDCLNSNRRILVVPNEALADTNQVQFCEELKKYELLRWSRCDDIAVTLEGYSGQGLRRFPENATPTFASALRHLCGRPSKEEQDKRNHHNRQRQDPYGYDRYSYDRY